MKHIKNISLVVLIALAFAGCKEDRPELDPPGSKLEGIHATWQLVQMDQVDIATLDQNALDVTDAWLNGGSYSVTFNSEDFSYSVSANGTPDYLSGNGTWAFDDNEFPTSITLKPDSGDSITLTLNRTIRPVDPNLMFQIPRFCGSEEEAYIAYNYTFIRSN